MTRIFFVTHRMFGIAWFSSDKTPDAPSGFAETLLRLASCSERTAEIAHGDGAQVLVSRTKDQVTLRLTVDGGWWGHAYVKPQRDGRPDDRLRLSYVSSYRHGGRTGAGTFLTLAAVSWFLCVEAPRISWMSLDDTLAFYEKFLERFGSAFGQEGIRISRPTPCDFALDKIRI